MAAHQQQQRAAIEQLKEENLRLQEVLVGHHSSDQDTEAAWLQTQIDMYKLKASQEEQATQQIQQELDNIKQQLRQHALPSKQRPPATNKLLPGGVSKQLVVLQERLSHQKQKLGSIVASNDAKQQAVQDLSKRTAAAQQAGQQLLKQLASIKAAAASAQELTAALQETQRKACQVSELLMSQDDAEHLALSAVAQQVAELQRRHQQLQLQQPVQQPMRAPAALGQCSCTCSEEEAQAVLSTLQHMLQQAGLLKNRKEAANVGSADSGSGAAAAPPHNAQLAQQLVQLDHAHFQALLRCRIANCQQHQQQFQLTVRHQQPQA